MTLIICPIPSDKNLDRKEGLVASAVETFGKYILLEKLAAGGMAEVYLAKSTGAGGINKFVAIKRILPQYSDNPEFIEMFKEEASIAVNLNHGNVVSIFDFGVERKQFYLVMEYVEGQNLRQILNHLKRENKYFSIDQIVYMCKEVAAGLDHAHRCLDGTTGKPLNITHRDMSPQNVMVSFEGEVKVVDFGIAKKAESEIESTRAGTIKGKFGYMSPEQADGQIVDLRTDIFSLGIVLWELLASDRLFASNSEAATLKKIRDCQIPSLRKLNPSIPPELERIVNKALAKDKTLRYQTAASFHRDLNRFLNTQYPEFSPHDFSVFMKSAFSAMFMENRKKLIEFAKIKADELGSNEASYTNTVTETSQGTSQIIEGDNLRLDLGVDNQEAPSSPTPPVDLKELNRRNLTRSGAHGSASINPHTMTAAHDRINRTSVTGPRAISPAAAARRRQQDSSWGIAIASLILMTVIAGGGWYYFKTGGEGHLSSIIKLLPDSMKPTADTHVTAPPKIAEPQDVVSQTPVQTVTVETIPTPEPEQVKANIRETYVVIIQSAPSGARIFIDGQDTGMITPAQRILESGKEYSVGLKRDGYQYYEKKALINQPGYIVKASLLPNPKMGYINLEITNGGLNPVIYINGVRIDETPPLQNYAIVAGMPVKISAHNPFTNLWGEKTVQVGVNQRIQVNLLLTQKKSAENNR